METRQWLASRVMPAIFEALRALDAARPNDPLNFIATELEAHSVHGMHNKVDRSPKNDGSVDMFAYTNGVVRDALLKALRSVAAERPREPLRAIAEELRSLPAWSAASWTSQPNEAARTDAKQEKHVSAMSGAVERSGPQIGSSSQLLASHLERADSDSKLRSTTPASSSVLRSPTRASGPYEDAE